MCKSVKEIVFCIFGIVYNAIYATHYNRRLNAGLTLLALCTMPFMQLSITTGLPQVSHFWHCPQCQICCSISYSVCLSGTGVSTHYNRRLNAGLTLLALCTMPFMQFSITDGLPQVSHFWHCLQCQLCCLTPASISLSRTGVSTRYNKRSPAGLTLLALWTMPNVQSV